MGRKRVYKNEYVDVGEHVELRIVSATEEVLYVAKIDHVDVEKVKQHHWCRRSNAQKDYLSSNICLLHELIVGTVGGLIIDHINRDRCDCRKSNLRHVTPFENAINKGKQSNNTSGYVGVSWDKGRSKWASHIKVNRKKKFLGRFEKLEDAVSARLDAERKYFGDVINREFDVNTVHEVRT